MAASTSKTKSPVDEYSDLDIFKNASPQPGSLNVDLELRIAINEAIRLSGKDRNQIRCELYELTKTDLGVHVLNTWTAESKSKNSENEDQNNNKRWGIPAEMVPALCHVTGDTRPLKILLRVIGLEVMSKEQQVALYISELKEERKETTRKLKAAEKLSKKVRS